MTATDMATETTGTGSGRYADVNGLHLYYETHGSRPADRSSSTVD